MTKSSKSKANGLMGDLESIKALLEEDDLTSEPESLSQALNPLLSDAEDFEPEPEVPTLEDPVEDGLKSFDPKTGVSTPLDLPPLDSKSYTEDLDDTDLPDPDLLYPDLGINPPNIDGLLSDDFRNANEKVMQRARALIRQHANVWTPQQTDELADALRVRIDDAVALWIETSLEAHANELQERLIKTVRLEIARHLEAFDKDAG